MPEQKPFYRLNRHEWALMGITMLWGITFLIVRNALTVSGPLFIVAFRFGFAALLISLISLPVLREITRTEIFAGMAIGLALFVGYALQTVGLQWISASKSAFITAFYVPMVPLLQWFFMHRPPHVMAWIGIACAFAGLLCLAGPDGVSLGFSKGELLTVFSALVMAVEIVLISFFAGKVSVRRVSIVQAAFTSILAFIFMPLTGEALPNFSWLLAGAVLALGLTSALVQFVMNWAQKSVTPTRATVIYAGEPVWAGIFGRMAGERLPFIALLGGALIVLGVLISELRVAKRKFKSK